MFCKTSVGHEHGCIAGELGPVRLPLPVIGLAIEDSARGWKVFRYSEDIMILADCFAESKAKDRWARFMTYMHGILLRRLGKKRVVYIVRRSSDNDAEEMHWHSNVNLVTGVSMSWLDEEFRSVPAERYCVVAGYTLASYAQRHQKCIQNPGTAVCRPPTKTFHLDAPTPILARSALQSRRIQYLHRIRGLEFQLVMRCRTTRLYGRNLSSKAFKNVFFQS